MVSVDNDVPLIYKYHKLGTKTGERKKNFCKIFFCPIKTITSTYSLNNLFAKKKTTS